MSAKRLISNEQREKNRKSKVYKGKDFLTMSRIDKDNLLKILAEKLNLL